METNLHFLREKQSAKYWCCFCSLLFNEQQRYATSFKCLTLYILLVFLLFNERCIFFCFVRAVFNYLSN